VPHVVRGRQQKPEPRVGAKSPIGGKILRYVLRSATTVNRPPASVWGVAQSSTASILRRIAPGGTFDVREIWFCRNKGQKIDLAAPGKRYSELNDPETSATRSGGICWRPPFFGIYGKTRAKNKGSFALLAAMKAALKQMGPRGVGWSPWRTVGRHFEGQIRARGQTETRYLRPRWLQMGGGGGGIQFLPALVARTGVLALLSRRCSLEQDFPGMHSKKTVICRAKS